MNFVYNNSTIKAQKAVDKKQKFTGEIQNSGIENNKSKNKTQNPVIENNKSKNKTQNPVIENNKSTNVTQEYTHEDREHENWGNTTNDSNKYPKTDNGFGAKNLKLILPVALGGTAAVGVIKHFSNKNRQK